MGKETYWYFQFTSNLDNIIIIIHVQLVSSAERHTRLGEYNGYTTASYLKRLLLGIVPVLRLSLLSLDHLSSRTTCPASIVLKIKFIKIQLIILLKINHRPIFQENWRTEYQVTLEHRKNIPNILEKFRIFQKIIQHSRIGGWFYNRGFGPWKIFNKFRILCLKVYIFIGNLILHLFSLDKKMLLLPS